MASASELRFNPDDTKFPTRKDLPKIDHVLSDAAWFWGKDDSLGRLNLLTPTRVRAAAAEIKTGEIVPLNLPLNVPETPAFGRLNFQHTIQGRRGGAGFDDLWTYNTQGSSQWDGFRHFAHQSTGTFYNGVTAADIVGPDANQRCSISHWADHGIAGRGVLLDYRAWATAQGTKYDCFTTHRISYADLVACGKAQGIDIRPEAQGGDIKIGDILLVRSGWTEDYYAHTAEERKAAALRGMPGGDKNSGQAWAGVAQESAMLDWLHDCYFAAVAGDAPAFEAWPPKPAQQQGGSGTASEMQSDEQKGGYFLHEYLLARWGVPLGELWDLERLSARCSEERRWTFFVTSAVANVPGGIASGPNALAFF